MAKKKKPRKLHSPSALSSSISLSTSSSGRVHVSVAPAPAVCPMVTTTPTSTPDVTRSGLLHHGSASTDPAPVSASFGPVLTSSPPLVPAPKVPIPVLGQSSVLGPSAPAALLPSASGSASLSPDPRFTAHPIEPPVGPVSELQKVTVPISCWRNLVQGSAKLQKKGKPFLLDSGDICVDIPNAVIQKHENRWKDFIIGQFHGNAPPPGTFHAIVNGIWSPKLKNISISKLSAKAYLIKIPCPHTRSRILSQGVWHIERQTMFVAKWQPGLTPDTPELTSVPVWLDFHNVPLQFYSEEGLEHIAGALGDPLLLHPRTKSMVNLEIARVLTVVDPTKPLPEAVYVRFESGHKQRIEVSCQWLPPTCSHCHQVGHSIKRCPTAPVTCPQCKSSAHTHDNCPRSMSGTNLGCAPKFTGRSSHQPMHPAPAPLPVPEQPLVASPSTVVGSLVLDIGPDKMQSLGGQQPIGAPSPSKGQLSTMVVQQEQGSTSKSFRSRRKLPTYFTSLGSAVLSSETDFCSSDTETSYNHSDADEFPPLSARHKKVEASKAKKPYKN